jgi:hypothetical protein
MKVVEERQGRRRIYGSSRSSRVNARAEADASTMTGKGEVYSRGKSEAVLIARQH